MWNTTDDCCTRKCSTDNPCLVGEGECIMDNECLNPDFNMCELNETCNSQKYFPLDEFPNNTDLNYQDIAHCCRRRCYPHEPCAVER